MDYKNHPSLCILPFTSLSIGTMGEVLRCQMSREPMGHLSQNRLVDIINNEKYQTLRKNMLAGTWDPYKGPFLPGCSPCQNREAQGVTSKRIHRRSGGPAVNLWNQETFASNQMTQIVHMDLAFNNICNFKCRMCNSAFSTKWKADEAALKESGFEVIDRQSRFQQGSYDLAVELKSIMPLLKGLKGLEIVGGEPFLAPAFFEFIEDLKRHGIWSQIDFMVTTNGSVLKKEMLELLDGCRRININISVDATGDMFEYLRSSGACTWETFDNNVETCFQFIEERNMNQSKTFWRMNLNGAFQTYNMLNVFDFVSWIIEKLRLDQNPPIEDSGKRNSFEHRILMTPIYLNAQYAPSDVKKEAARQVFELYSKYPWISENFENRYLHDILKFLEAPEKSGRDEIWNMFERYTHSLDKIRNQNYQRTVPWLEKYFILSQAKAALPTSDSPQTI